MKKLSFILLLSVLSSCGHKPNPLINAEYLSRLKQALFLMLPGEHELTPVCLTYLASKKEKRSAQDKTLCQQQAAAFFATTRPPQEATLADFMDDKLWAAIQAGGMRVS